MPPSYRSDVTSEKDRFPVPKLELDVTYTPRGYDVTYTSRHDVTGSRWRSSQYSERSTRATRCCPRHCQGHCTCRLLHTGHRSDLYDPFDPDYGTARVRIFSRDSVEQCPVHCCTCVPCVSDKNIPSMIYERLHCPRHHYRRWPPVRPDNFAYPWTVQTYRPTYRVQYGYKRGQIKPPSALTAPPFVQYTSKQPHPRHDHHHPPPYSAPVHPPSISLLSAHLTDRRLRRADRRRSREFSPLAPLVEDVSPWDSVSQVALPVSQVVLPDDGISPWDSVSQVAPLATIFRPVSPRLRALAQQRRAESERRWRLAKGGNYVRPAADTPRPRHNVDLPHLPLTSSKIFKGDYNHFKDDPKIALAKRRQLKTV